MHGRLQLKLHCTVAQDYGRERHNERNSSLCYGQLLAFNLQHFILFVYLPGKEKVRDRSANRAGNLQIHFCLRGHIFLPCCGGQSLGGVETHPPASSENGLVARVCLNW